MNSLRGIRFWGDHANISILYDMGARYFPTFNADVKTHLMRYAKTPLKQKIRKFSSFRATSFDWYIADLFNGDLHQGSSYRTAISWFSEGGSDGINAGALGVGNDAAYLHMPPHVRDLLIDIKKRNLRRRSRVVIEELEPAKPIGNSPDGN